MRARGVSPIVATILLIALTISACGAVAIVVGGILPSGYAPLVDIGEIQTVAADNTNRVSFKHIGGEPFRLDEIRVTISGMSDSTSIKITSDNTFSFCDKVTFTTEQGEPYYPVGTEVRICIVHDPTGTILADAVTIVGDG